MTAQRDEIEGMLSAEGWHVAERTVAPEWWLDELWTLESAWSPVGDKAFVSFLVDGAAPAERKRGEHVWAVVVGRTAASQWTGPGAIPLGPNWESVRRSEVEQQIRALRHAA